MSNFSSFAPASTIGLDVITQRLASAREGGVPVQPISLKSFESRNPFGRPRVLCFTASRKRPAHLARCHMSMQLQTYPLTHGININSEGLVTHDCSGLLARIGVSKHNSLHVLHSLSVRQHWNYLAAIAVVPDWHKYDLFIKVDDDDIYAPSYVANVVESFVTLQWDFSGCHSYGAIRGDEWLENARLLSLGETPQDELDGVEKTMPPTYAFSLKAMSLVVSLDDDRAHSWEDQMWRQAIYKNKLLKKCIREDQRDFFYHVHECNTAMTALKPVPKSPFQPSRSVGKMTSRSQLAPPRPACK